MYASSFQFRLYNVHLYITYIADKTTAVDDVAY